MALTYEELLGIQKKRRKKEEEVAKKIAPSYSQEYIENEMAPYKLVENNVNRGFAPIVNISPTVKPTVTTSKKDDDERTWFKKGSGNIVNTILGTTVDVFEDLGTGIIGMGEKAVDFLAMVGTAMGNAQMQQNMNDAVAFSAVSNIGKDKKTKEKAVENIINFHSTAQNAAKKGTTEFVKKDLYDESKIAKKIITTPFQMATDINVEESSVLGDKSDALLQSGGQLLATAGLQALGVPWFLTTGATSFGAEAENALNQGATFEQATMSAAISAGAEILTEKLSGGIKFKMPGMKAAKTLDDILVKPFLERISNDVVKTLATLGVDAVGEGAEEILSGMFSNLGSALYKEEDLTDILFSKEAWKEYLESFIGGMALGGFSSGVRAVANRNAIELDEDEQKVFDKVVEERIAEATEDGKKTLSKKDESKIRNDVLRDMLKGYIDTDTIESVLGGEEYETYKAEKDKIDGAIASGNELLSDLRQTLKTITDEGQQAEIENRIQQTKDILEKLKNNENLGNLKSKLGQNVFDLVKDSRLSESYREIARHKQNFEADTEQYENEYAKRTVQNAIDYRNDEGHGLDNTNASHDFIDLMTKYSADREVEVVFTTTKGLAELKKNGNKYGIKADPKKINAFVSKEHKKLFINMDTDNNLYSLVGHEVTHTTESAKHYEGLLDSVKSFIGEKEFDELYKKKAKTYEDFNLTKLEIEQEIVADFCGERLLTDYDFVKHLAVNNQNIFQKAWDSIKHLYKMATAGSKEARQLERVKRNFEKAYKEAAKTGAKVKGTKNSLSEEQEAYFKDSKVRDENGNLKVMYHGTSKGGFNSFDTYGSNYGLMGTGSYFTDNKSIAESYTNKGKGNNKQVYEAYLNITNPLDMDAQGNAEEWAKAFPDVDFPESGTNEQFYRAVEEFYSDQMMPKWEAAEEIRDSIQFGMGYDGITHIGGGRVNADGVKHQVYIAFEPEQIKNIDNVAPTKDADIRYSLSEDNTNALEKAFAEELEFHHATNGGTRYKNFASWVDEMGSRIVAEEILATWGTEYDSNSILHKIIDAKADVLDDVELEDFVTGFIETYVDGELDDSDIVYKENKRNKSFDDWLDEHQILPWEEEYKDSEGNKLTKEQHKYFEGSQAVDRNGNLLKVYHTTKNDFTVFDKSRKGEATEDANTYLGFFFTDDAEYMQNFPEFENGKTESYYLDMKNPIDMTDISEEAFLDIVEVMGGDVDEAADVYAQELADEQDRAKLRGDNRVSLTLGNLLDELTGEFYYQDFITELKPHYDELMSKGYDGVINYMDELFGAKEYIVLDSNQAKLTSNLNPTAADDVRYSLTEDELQEEYKGINDIKYNYGAIESHKKSLAKKITVDSSIDLDTIMQRYDKIIGIWDRIGGELNSKFLNDWNNKTERPFTIFKAQAGYKYNVELSSMCKKGVPLFEAIDTIVKKEVMKDINLDVIGKEEKEILYDILKQHSFEIPCAICYVEQARQREGVIIDAFLNGNKDGKLGWNQVLDSIEAEMSAKGITYRFPSVSRDIATDRYEAATINMDDSTAQTFYSVVQKLANQEIKRYNKEAKKNRKLLKNTTPEAVNECFKGTLPANLKIFKTLLTEPSSRFRIENDLLYSSMATRNLSTAHNKLYSLFNSQGGVSGYKTKQGTTIYWGEILGKNWIPSTTRNEGGVRNQSNSDFQAYTLLDQAQMYMDFTAKGYYLQAYTKVLSELKLFGLSKGKINASLIPKVKVYYDAEGNVDAQRTMENAGLDENGNLIFDDFEGINHKEAFMLIEDAEYSKNICGICIGYSDNHIEKLLDDNRVQLIIGFHDKTNNPDKRYRGARYAKNYNGLNEAVKKKDGKTVHIGFNKYVNKAEKRFTFNEKTESFEGKTTFKGKEYIANDIPRLAADMYLDMCDKKGYTPAYEMFSTHPNYYKLLADFGLYDSQGNYAPHRKVEYNMPDTVPYLDENGNKKYMSSEAYIKAELQKELAVRDAIAEALSDTSENGIIPQFKAEIERRRNPKNSLREEGETFGDYGNLKAYAKDITVSNDIAPVQETAEESSVVAPTQEVAPASVAEPLEETPTESNDTEAKPTKRSELHQKIVEGIKTKFAEKGFDFDEVLKKAKNLSTFATVDNIPQRVMEKALGYKQGQALADETVNKVAQNESEGIKWLNSFTDRKNGVLAQISKQYNIKPGSKESAAAQMYAEGFYVDKNNEIVEYGDRELAIDFPNARVRENIKGLAKDERIRQIYDETLEAINESRRRNLYPEIQRLDNYFLHFRAMEDTFSRLGLPFNPNDIRAKDLPTDLNGVTADLKPGQPYFASAMHREGMRTSFDLLGGLERYLSSAKNQIYHIDDIQTLRALRNYIADTYGQAKGLESLDNLSEEEAQERIEQVYGSHLSTFAKFLNEEANVLAGKTTLIDRGLEGVIGRRGITFLNTVNSQVGSNMVGFNVSSSLTNFLPVVQTFAKTNKFDFTKAFAQTVSSKIGSIFGKTDGFVENNPTIIRRKGAERFYRTPFQKIGDTGYVLMSAVDDISTELIVRTKYNELVRKGMDEQKASFEADKWVSRLMGDRSLGQQPQLYNSKMLGIVTKFQLEVRNQLDSQFYDTVQEAKVSNEEIESKLLRNAKTAAKVCSTFFQLAVLQHLFGKAFESVAGYNPAFDIIEVLIKTLGFDDDEEDEDTVLDNIEEGFFALLEDLPYTSTFTGGRIPISSALPIKEFLKGEDQYGNEKSRWDTIKETAPYYLLPTGYGQVKKTVQGLGMFSDKHPVAGSYTDSGNLRFPVEDTLWNRVQAGVFGQYANKNARTYFDEGYAPLKEKQIQEYIDVDMPIKDYWQYREDIKDLDTLEEKFDFVAGMDLPVEKKNILINNIVDRKEKVDLENYDDFENYEEFDFYAKNTEKYNFLQDNGVSYKQYKADEDTKEKYDSVYSWWKNYPEKVTVSKAVTDNVIEYRGYTSDLDDIRADKDENGKSISGSAKEKKKAYIWSLDIDEGAKYILFKNEYKADDTYNNEIIDYLNSRDDISYDEMNTICEELGFKVNRETGYISWD